LADQVGRVVGGRYRLLAPIGAGASADVYVADDVNLRRRVAIKILRDALAGDEGFLRRFRAEARAVASLRHPNIVTVYDWGEEDTGPYLVLEYLGGGSLRDLLDRGHRLSPSQAVLVGLEAARGLEYAHRRGLVHRDIKPANLLFDDEGRLAIADFGIARALAEATWTEPAGAVVGTVRYASPEQARGQSVDGRADVYGLALALVEATTGNVPFAADTTLATLMARLGRAIPTFPELGPLAGVIEAAGAVDPADRLDAAGLTVALDRVARDLPRPGALPLAAARQLPLPHDELDSTTTFAPLPNGRDRRPDPAAVAGPATTGPVVATLGAGMGDVAPTTAAASETATPAVVTPSGDPKRRSRARRRERDGDAARRPRRRRRVVVLAVVLVVAIAGSAGAVLLPPVIFPTYATPALVGLGVPDATARARPHFTVVVHHERVTDKAVGVVLAQTPLPSTHHRPGPITVDVSDGNALAAVPDLTGLPAASAMSALRTAGFVPKQSATAFSPTVPAGDVISWSPRGQAAVRDVVGIVTSLGPQFLTMPDLVTIPISADQATTQLEQLGIPASAITRKQDFSDTVPTGDVIATTPLAGQQADRAGTVALDVSKGPDVVPVPSVRGRSVSSAEATLRQAGFVPQTYGPPGASIVVDQQPLPGTSVKRGSQVLLVAF
jgi:beta-lactam-binding protein with PASTA domain/tRNA A-37 threonylcarbamoyl transferase component Bud32